MEIPFLILCKCETNYSFNFIHRDVFHVKCKYAAVDKSIDNDNFSPPNQ